MTSIGSSISRQRMAKIWARFGEIYGHKWTSQYGDQFPESWATGLSGLTNLQIAAGFRWCICQSGDSWPPSLPEFRAACLAESVDGYPAGEEAYRQGMAYARAVQFGAPVPETLPGIRFACRQATCLALVSTPAESSRKLFAYHFGEALKALAAGVEFPCETPKALTAEIPPCTPEEVTGWCGQLRGLLKPLPTTSPVTAPTQEDAQ